jgi:hypothetical protein
LAFLSSERGVLKFCKCLLNHSPAQFFSFLRYLRAFALFLFGAGANHFDNDEIKDVVNDLFRLCLFPLVDSGASLLVRSKSGGGIRFILCGALCFG